MLFAQVARQLNPFLCELEEVSSEARDWIREWCANVFSFALHDSYPRPLDSLTRMRGSDHG